MSREQEQQEEATPVHRVLVGLVGAVCRFPRLVLAAAAVLVGLSIWIACAQLTFLTQRNDLVSPRQEHQQKWKQYLAEFGDDDDMVVVVKGQNRKEMEQALEKLAGELLDQPKLFDRIFYKVDLRSLHDRALLYLSV